MPSGSVLLAEWVEKRGYERRADAAEVLGISEGYISLLLSGDRAPGRDKAVEIQDLTGIPVSAWSLRRDNKRKTPSGTNGRNRLVNKE